MGSVLVDCSIYPFSLPNKVDWWRWWIFYCIFLSNFSVAHSTSMSFERQYSHPLLLDLSPAFGKRASAKYIMLLQSCSPTFRHSILPLNVSLELWPVHFAIQSFSWQCEISMQTLESRLSSTLRGVPFEIRALFFLLSPIWKYALQWSIARNVP